MANPHRGEVALEAGGRTYTLQFSVNAICELEAELDKPVVEIVDMLNDPTRVRIGTVRALAWAALQDNHPETGLKQAGNIVSEVGFHTMMEKLGEALQLAFPEQEGGKQARPPKAKGKTR